MPLSTILLPSLLSGAGPVTMTDTCVTCSPDALIVAGFIAAVVAVAFLVTAAQNRRAGPDAAARPRLCRSCALSHPPFAHYCRRCGRRL